jgi:3-phosphoshikimate 1-carboxyvinyltransferase
MQGVLRPPSDKSLTHRAYMLGAIADGASVVKSPLLSEDCEATLRCLTQMGLDWTRSGEEVHLTPGEWRSPIGELDCGNSGTTMRLLSGLIASRPISATLIGDASLSRRPMKRIAEPLRLMGATVEGDTPPLRIQGGSLQGVRYETPVASAQIKSCVLLAGLGAEGETWVREPHPSRDHTERMLSALGVDVMRDGGYVGVKGGSKLQPFSFQVPGDISSAAFFLVAGALLPDASVRAQDVSVNPTRTGILEVFEAAGVRVVRENEREQMGEPVADLDVVSEDVPLAFQIGGGLVSRLIDEVPVLAVMATQCDGLSEIRDAKELRVKESDRIELMVRGLTAMGARVEALVDGMKIWGPTRLKGTTINAEGDHRIAMAFAIAGLLAEGQTHIEGAECIATSFPDFEEELWRLCIV